MNKILSENLYEGLKKVKITKVNKYLPVLNCAKLEFSNGELTITTTDLENSYIAKVPCITMNDEFSTCVPMQTRINVSKTRYRFMDFIKVCAEYRDVLEFTFDPKIQILTIKVQGERSITEFKCIDAEEFPAIAASLV